MVLVSYSEMEVGFAYPVVKKMRIVLVLFVMAIAAIPLVVAQEEPGFFERVLSFLGIGNDEDSLSTQETPPPPLSQQIVVAPSSTFSIRERSDDDDIHTLYTEINNTLLEFTINEKRDLPGGFRWSLALCNVTQAMDIMYYEEDAQGGFNNSVPLPVNYGKLTDFGLNDTWCGNSGGYGYVLFSSGSRQQLPYTYRVQFEEPYNTQEFELYTGAGTEVLVATSRTPGNTPGSFNERIFYDALNDRWHLIYIDTSQDLHSASAGTSNLSNWTDGGALFTGFNFDYGEMDCARAVNGTHSYFHCISGISSDETIHYMRCEMTGSDPFVSCGSRQSMFTSSAEGGEAADDVGAMSIVIDSNDCVVVAFMLEDDSLANNDEHQVYMLKENSSRTCGNGVFSTASGDNEIGFPLGSIQTTAGFSNPSVVGITIYGGDQRDVDAQLTWINSDSTTSADLETVHFDGDTNSIGTEVSLNADIEFNTQWKGYDNIAFGNTSISFGMDDGTNDLDAYNISVKDGTSFTQTDTGADVCSDFTDCDGPFKSVFDDKAPGDDDFYIIYVFSAVQTQIREVNTSDGGLTYQFA